MGLEVDTPLEPLGPPIFTGKALSIRFPDVEVMQPNGKLKLQEVRVTNFPHWIFKVNINNQVYDLKGSELQNGMFVEFKEKLLMICEINEIDYHGMEIPSIPLARPPLKTDEDSNIKFERLFFDDGRIEWKISETGENTK